jgi:glycerophosphoryl diester phosphodiesterase
MSLLDIAMTVVDSMMAVIPRPVPERAALERCKIISHRGEHDNKRVMENTLQAFDRARSAGVWGLECDIRWTADLVPVICHDPSPARVFGVATPLNSLTFDQLHIQVPDIPRLEDVLRRFGGNTHLMLELKA